MSNGLSNKGLDSAMAEAAIAAKKCGLSFEVTKRLLGGSGSVGNVTLGETKGVIVSEEVTAFEDCNDASLEALESGLCKLSSGGGNRGCELVVGESTAAAGGSSDGGNGACGSGGVARISSDCCLLWHFLEVMCEE